MNFSIFIVLVAALVNAFSIISPAQNVSEVPVWPETLFEWTWGPSDPATVNIVIRYQFANNNVIPKYIYKANFSAEQGSVTIPWIPLGLDIGTRCELALLPVGDIEHPYITVGPFYLVKASGDAPSASNYPSTIYTTTSASRTYIVTSTVGPIETALSSSSEKTTISTTTSDTTTYTVTSEVIDMGTETATMSSFNAVVLTGTMPVSHFSSTTTSVTTVNRTRTITGTVFETDRVTIATPSIHTPGSSSVAASSSLDITFSPTPYSYSGSHGVGSSAGAIVDASSADDLATVYVTVTETAPCSGAAASSDMSTSIDTSDPVTLTATPTDNSVDPTSTLVSPPPFPTTSSDSSVMANTTATASNPITFQRPTFPTTATIAIQTMTGGASSIFNALSIQTATGVYIAGLTVLAYVAFMHGIGI